MLRKSMDRYLIVGAQPWHLPRGEPEKARGKEVLASLLQARREHSATIDLVDSVMHLRLAFQREGGTLE